MATESDRSASTTDSLGVLLSTKTAIPRLRPGLLTRPEGVDLLGQAVESGLALISAPAGFGKTTLLAEWASTAEFPVAWLSLDPDDDDPVRFLRYFVAAVKQVEEGFGVRLAALTTGPNRPAVEALAAVLVNELASLTEEIAIVIDDYHVIESPSVHELVSRMVEYLPPNRVHLVISSRVDPPLPLSRLRGRDRVREVRVDHLRFAPREISAFFSDVWGLSLPTDVVEAVGARTEGWAAGLHLAALAIRDAPDTAGFAAAFTGTHRYVLDFLSEEVLGHLPEDIRRFLVETSILARVSAPLAGALTGRSDSAQLLEHLERANLFIVALDDDRRWYRYHQLFAEALMARLRLEGRERELELQRSAALWSEKEGLVDEAIRHWLAGDDPERAAGLIERHVEEIILRTSQRATMDRWLRSLPDVELGSHPRLSLAQGIAALIEGRVEEVELHLQMAERAGPAQGVHEPSVGREASVLANVPALIEVIHAGLARLRGLPEAEENHARSAMRLLSDVDVGLRSQAEYHLAVADWMSGRLPAAERGLESVIADRRGRGARYLAARACYDLGQVQIARCKLRAATSTYRQAIDLVTRSTDAKPAAAGFGIAGLAEVSRLRGNLETALADSTESVDLCRHLAYAPSLATALVTLGWTRQALGDHEGALEAINEAVGVVSSEEVSVLHDPTDAERARLALAQGRVDQAADWMAERGLGDADPIPYPREREYLVAARVLLALRESQRARRLLVRIESRAESEGRTRDLVVARALLALALAASGEQTAGLVKLSQATSLARPSGLVAAFADEGPGMGEMLQRLAVATRRGDAVAGEWIPPEFLARLIRACITASPGTVAPESLAIELPKIVEPLSARELEVTKLLALGETNRQIADELFLSIETVKKHVSHICSKLGAVNRTQAVSYARELGII